MATAATFITAALRKIGVSDPGETLSSAKMNGGLEALNDMLSSWSAEGILVYANTQENFSLTSAQSYTIGTGGIFNTVVPIEIVSAFTRIGNNDYPCDIVTVDEYNSISDKTVSGSYPELIAFRRSGTLGKIYAYPVSTGTLYLENRKLLQQFALSSTTFTMPEESSLAIKTNLSVVLAPEYGKQVDQNLADQASKTKATLKSLYITVPKSKFEFSGSSRYNVIGDS
jgi:hypothetical protein